MTYRAAAVVIALIGGFAIVGAQPSAEQVTVPLTDPGRPASLNLQLVRGGITVRGSNRRDVLVIARASAGQPQNEIGGGTGLRQVAQAPAFTVTENHNEVLFVLHTPDRAIDFEIQVPSHTNLKLGTTDVHASIAVEGVDGDLEVNNPSGPITLSSVGGSIVASSVEGDVRATITTISMQRPMALSSFNRDVDVTFPSSLKANLRLRSDQGKVFTDFDVTPLPPPTVGQNARREGGQSRIESNRFSYGAVNGGGPEIELRTYNGNVYVRRAQ
jgi:DUF4097 and DUF4098 domain-containing protein YvlB